MRCGTCRKALVGHEAKSGQFAYYVCGSLLKRGAGACSTPYLNAQRLEGRVIDRIKAVVLTDENLRDLVRLVNEELDNTARKAGERIEVIEAELDDVRRRLDRLYEALESGNLTMADLSPRIRGLRHRQDQLEAAKEDAQRQQVSRERVLDAEIVAEQAEDLRRVLEESSLSERKAFIRSFVKEITVQDQEAVLRYTAPWSLTGVNKNADLLELSASVLSTVQDGGR